MKSFVDYQIVAGLHGNEKKPVEALTRRRVEFVVGNPEALKKGSRFVDQDLNRSFDMDGSLYEIGRAKELLGELDGRIVVDLHTFTAPSPAFSIITDLRMLKHAKVVGLERVVYMKFSNKSGHALIENVDGVSVELGQHKDKLVSERVGAILDNLERGVGRPVQLFEVYDIIKEPSNYVNFELHEKGFYPVLSGENAYDFIGLKAKLIENIEEYHG